MPAFDQIRSIIEKESLSRSLTASLRIADALADEEFASWIKLELLGYLKENPSLKQDTVVPDYRAVAGLWYDGFGRPLMLNGPELGFVNQVPLRHGITELEGLSEGNGPLSVAMPEMSDLIRQNLHVEVSLFKFSRGAVRQILTAVKVRLIEHLTSRKAQIAALPEMKVPQAAEILQLKPNIYGVGVDLRALWRRLFGQKK